MDHAFQSRIQIAIPYTELTRTQREAVWTSLLNSNLIDVTEHDKAIITENVRALSEHQLNGRQIRNTLKLAFFLALDDITSDRKVQLKHIEKALKEALQFQEFLRREREIPRTRIVFGNHLHLHTLVITSRLGLHLKEFHMLYIAT
jgi:hypothetical protein